MYCAEAERMEKEFVPDFDSLPPDQRITAIKSEKKKIRFNTMYYMNRYVWLKDSKSPLGKVKIKLYEVQKVKAFLFDLGLNLLEAKQRQIGGTSFYLPAMLKNTEVNNNYLSIFCCESDAKAKSIFEDKLKYTFYEQPEFLKPSVQYNTKNGMTFGRKVGKDDVEGLNSRIQIAAPYPTLINGEESNCIGIDEAAAISILTEILDEGRPTIFGYDENGNKFIKRQIVIWSSSNEGEGQKVSDAFEFEFKSLFTNFEKGIYTSGFIPLFFDYNTRYGYSEKEYQEEKFLAESKASEGSQNSLIRFRKHNPASFEDFFLKTIETIIPYNMISDQLDRIYLAIKRGAQNPHEGLVPQRGYFVPVYDTKRPMPEKDISPYAIIDAEWVPCNNSETHLASTTIILHPNHKWRDRYYMGKDPVQDIAGHSKAAASVFDAQLKTIAAQLFYRPEGYKKTYEQALLLNLYYTPPDLKYLGIKELIEWNIGKSYVEYRERQGLDKNLVGRLELPAPLQSGEHWVGISKKSDNKEEISRYTQELYYNYLAPKNGVGGIYMEETCKQLKTYVKKSNSSKEKYSFKPSDPKRDNDDVIDSDTYSYVCYVCYQHLKPYEVDEQIKQKQRQEHWVTVANGYGSYRLVKKIG
jgi:hypothetical protein